MSATPARAAEILRDIRYITLASITPKNEPWNSPLYYVYDTSLRLYWFSDKNSQHSQNVRENPSVFIVVYDSTMPAGTGEGVYIQATVRELEDTEEIVRVRKLAKGESFEASPSDFQGNAVRRVYEATPTAVWMNSDEKNGDTFVRDIRVQIAIDTLKKEVARA